MIEDCKNREVAVRVCFVPPRGGNVWVLKEFFVTLSIEFKRAVELDGKYIDGLVFAECQDSTKRYTQQVLCGRIARKILTIPGAINACVVMSPVVPEAGDERSEVNMTANMLECMP